MYTGSVKRKKISLWLLILIVLFIISVIFTIIHIFNSSKASTDGSSSKKSSSNTITNDFSTSFVQGSLNPELEAPVEAEDEVAMVTAFTNFYEIDTDSVDVINVEPTPSVPEPTESTPPQQDTSAKKTLTLKNHKYKFNEDKNVVLVDDKYIQYDSPDCIINMFADKLNFSDLKTKSGLKEFLQNKYNVEITSKIKAGNMNNNELIVFTMTEDKEAAYFFITPLNNSEILCFKVYNSEDMSILIKDISKPIDEISSIKSNVQ